MTPEEYDLLADFAEWLLSNPELVDSGDSSAYIIDMFLEVRGE